MLNQTSRRRPFSADEKAEISADSFYTALEALERAERHASDNGFSRAEIAIIAGMDPSRVTKILGGSERNITLKTLFRLMKAMGRKVYILSENYDDLKSRRPNFDFEANRLQYDPKPQLTYRYNTLGGTNRGGLL